MQMGTDTNNRLPYKLYLDGSTEIGASASGGDKNNFIKNGMGNGEVQNMNIFARVIGADSKKSRPGNYSDELDVTIAF
jgi:spore coat protein U-like protein